MRIKKKLILLMILLSLFISSSLVGCDKEKVNNSTIKNESVNCDSVDDSTENNENNSSNT